MAVKPGQLAVVSTPIGNLGDFSPRAAEALEKSDILACEDTRKTRKLLTLTGQRTTAKFMSYHDHNGHNVRPKLLAALASGSNIALISDAGTPLVSDPGYKLVAEAHEKGFSVTAIPGPSAVLAGLACAGLPSDRFLFAGFIPHTRNEAQKAFIEFANLKVTSIWFESPRRLAASLLLMREVFGTRFAVVARELTKLHENLQRAPLDQLANFYAKQKPPRGEVVILVEGASQTTNMVEDEVLTDMLTTQMQKGSLRDAVKTISEITGQPRRKIYQLAIELNN